MELKDLTSHTKIKMRINYSKKNVDSTVGKKYKDRVAFFNISMRSIGWN